MVDYCSDIWEEIDYDEKRKQKPVEEEQEQEREDNNNTSYEELFESGLFFESRPFFG